MSVAMKISATVPVQDRPLRNSAPRAGEGTRQEPPLPFNDRWRTGAPGSVKTAQCAEAFVTEELDDHAYRLDDGTRAAAAASCLVRPRRGDRVLAAACGSGGVYVLAVLERAAGQPAELGVPAADEVTLAAPRVTLRATERLQMQSLRDVDVTAVAGDVSLTGRNLLVTASEAIIENMRHYIGRAGAFALQVQSLLRLHGRQAFVTAQEDVKVDAERINLG